MQEHNKASAWFEEMYKRNKENYEVIPWVRKDVNPLLQSYLQSEVSHRGKALVIGCGVGDDAYALDKAGYDVVAIDIAQTALDLAMQRFPESAIVFQKQDIFDMPANYFEHFDFVFEALTIQSLPRMYRQKMIKAISNTLKKDGALLIVAHRYNGNNDGPPWPLKDEEIAHFLNCNMKEESFDLIEDSSQISNVKYRVLYKKD